MSAFDPELLDDFPYVCKTGSDPECPFTCVSLEGCEGCNCAVIDTDGGPWGNAMDVIMCLLPIIFLLAVTLKPNPLPTTVSLPSAALMLLLIRLTYLASDPLLVASSVISGLHEALSPLTIMFGAILLFETMEATLCMPYMMREMKALTQGHPVAELMILFAFAFMVEGASGFGTPVALGAPMLASLGYPKFQSVVTLLLMNTFATVWGAAGTPIWFGFGSLGLSEADFVEISYKAGTALVIAAFLLLPTMVLTFACEWRVLRHNILFVFVALSSSTLPALGLSFVSFEFPALIGGMVGCGLTAILIKCKVGLRPYIPPEESVRNHLEIDTTSDAHSIISSHRKIKKEEADQKSRRSKQSGTNDAASLHPVPEEVSAEANEKAFKNQPSSISVASAAANDEENSNDTDGDENGEDVEEPMDSHALIESYLGPRKSYKEGYLQEMLGRTFPLWGTVLLLVLTRIPQIGLKEQLTRRDPNLFTFYLGTYGTFKMSASFVLELQDILTYPLLNWKYELLYIPFIMPFAIISVLTMLLYRKDLQAAPNQITKTVLGRLKNPAVALMGALVLVQLLINEGPASPASIIGTILSDALKSGWIAVAAFIGALGSFFSGSTTISNLTFGEIHQIAAESIGVSTTSLLALQAAGASAGNGICLNNIISACAVVGLNVGEGKIIAKTALPVLIYCIIATLVMLVFLF